MGCAAQKDEGVEAVQENRLIISSIHKDRPTESRIHRTLGVKLDALCSMLEPTKCVYMDDEESSEFLRIKYFWGAAIK